MGSFDNGEPADKKGDGREALKHLFFRFVDLCACACLRCRKREFSV